jgi:hypothetical protein
MKKEVRHWSWFLNILLHMAGLRRQNNSLTLASFAYIHTCLLLCRNVSKRKHSYLSCWLNLHLTKMRPYPASKHYNQGMPISTPGMHCLLVWFNSRSPCALFCLSEATTCPLAGACFFKSASKLFVGVSFFLHP